MIRRLTVPLVVAFTMCVVLSAAPYDARLGHASMYVKKPCRLVELVRYAKRWLPDSATG